MSEIIRTTSNAIAPVSRVAVSIRLATLADIPFMDRMQREYGRQLGYFQTSLFEGYIEQRAILIAEESKSVPVGYVISKDRYLKRDELGVIYQLCVVPGEQRKLLGATLVQEVFARSAYGCRLYCCWCAQDIDANYFWESIGFVPIAFRAGSAKKKRVHIFWQRRVHADDLTTPYWYPCNTTGGAIAQDRLVFPIPPGTHWKDVQPIVLPGSAEAAAVQKKLPGAKRKPKAPPVLPTSVIQSGGLRLTPVIAPFLPVMKGKPERKPKVKVDPALVAKARELRDRWMDQLNSDAPLLGEGKYDVGRRWLANAPMNQLPAA